jgi:putative sigma-54 modulation protein
MQINVQGHGVELSRPLKEYAVKKIGKLDGFDRKIQKAQVVLDVRSVDDSKRSHVAEVSLWLSGKKVIRASEGGQDMYAAIDLVFDELVRQVKKHKEKHIKEVRRQGEKIKELTHSFAPEAASTGGPKLVKSKRFGISAMTREEALAETQKLGHDFFIFRDAETGDMNVLHKNKVIDQKKLKTFSEEEAAKQLVEKGIEFLAFLNSTTNELNVIYKRKSGNLGLIEPEL